MLSTNKEISEVILFLSKYPQSPEEYRDGFFQRVENIDQYYLNEERVYLSTSLFRNFKKKVIKHGLRTEVSCNFFLHFLYIFKLFKGCSLVYIQSIYNALNLILFINFIRKFYILDLHGAVPEELKLQNKMKYAAIFSVIEKILFKKVNICIAVTNQMKKYYQKKYPNSSCKYIVYAILPSHVKKCNIDELNIITDKVEIIYSGNMQVWQNIDLMLNSIRKNLSKDVKFTILTGELDRFCKRISEYGINSNKVIVKSVKPEELESYYKKCHYGFILRDDIVVNRVACPTKIVEYLNYGIKPIVLSSEIGDFSDYGYEYLKLEDLVDSHLSSCKSIKNIQIVEQIRTANNFNLRLELEKIMRF
ncbi:glycosyl transferase family 1 [Acinetobacter nosocomialis]|uniref:glycosyltransferase n=1 Tax=Acinetobacter TaxID=469 RepID=UPI0022EA5E55|nr:MULTISPECIES: glycosyltransferase [Acinetobacter]MDA3462107.1 glycosyl transferase family 1 [Acinetobacter sp. AOR41_HL]MDR9577221.1 glycosyl transferase family 1 [Acinetobacter nosocomialis]